MGESPGCAGAVVCEGTVTRVVGAWVIRDSSDAGAAELDGVDVATASGERVA